MLQPKLESELPTDLQMKSIPLKDLSSLIENIHFKTRDASQNTDLDMREFLGIDKALQNTDLDMREFLGIDKA